jgi:hypothetical protein
MSCVLYKVFVHSLQYPQGLSIVFNVGQSKKTTYLNSARINRTIFRENKPETLLFAKTGFINSGTGFLLFLSGIKIRLNETLSLDFSLE